MAGNCDMGLIWSSFIVIDLPTISKVIPTFWSVIGVVNHCFVDTCIGYMMFGCYDLEQSSRRSCVSRQLVQLLSEELSPAADRRVGF